jgi:hypothetical protein
MGDAMKTLLFAVLVLVFSTVDAAVLATAVNDLGGSIDLTDQPCDGTARVAITSEENGIGKEYGCYIIRDNKVLIFWHSLNRALSYPVDVFRVVLSS